MGRLHHVFQHAAHVAVDVFHLDGAVLCSLHDGIYLLGIARRQQVVAGSHLTVGMAGSGPVGHHDALESPFVTQDGGQQFLVLLCPGSVQEVIRAHDGPGLTLAHGNLEAFQVDFPQRTLVHHRIVVQSVGLLIVGSEVLGTHAHALTLYAFNHGCADKTGHERVFGIVFKVAAAEWRAHDVHARTKDDIATVFQRLVTHCLAHAFHQFGVPSGGQQRSDGESRTIVGIRVVRAFF